MTAKKAFRAVLTDVEQGVWLEEFRISEQPDLRLAGSSAWSISKRALRGGLSDGVDVIDLNNGVLSVSLLPTRGMGLLRGRYEGTRLGWDSPVSQPVNPAFVNLTDRDGLGWLAGFNEWMCRCGLASHGAPGVDVIRDDAGNESRTPLTLHGRIANLPAHRVEVGISPEGDGRLSVTGVVDETSMFGPCLRLTTTISTAAGSNRIDITDEITNRSGRAAEFELLYHTNFGPPLLEAGARFVAPITEVAPRDARAAEGLEGWQQFDAPQRDYSEQCYFVTLGEDASGNTAVLLRNAAGDKGSSLHFHRRQLPCFTLWKNTQSEQDGYVTGLEPGTSLPNLRSFEREQERLIQLNPGESYRIDWGLAAHRTAGEVQAIERQIAEIQSGCEPKVHGAPQPRWSPGA